MLVVCNLGHTHTAQANNKEHTRERKGAAAARGLPRDRTLVNTCCRFSSSENLASKRARQPRSAVRLRNLRAQCGQRRAD